MVVFAKKIQKCPKIIKISSTSSVSSIRPFFPARLAKPDKFFFFYPHGKFLFMVFKKA